MCHGYGWQLLGMLNALMHVCVESPESYHEQVFEWHTKKIHVQPVAVDTEFVFKFIHKIA